MLAFSVFSVQAKILPANGLRKGKEINNFDPGGGGGTKISGQRKYKTKKPGRSLDSEDT
jgi:hypothetical protein